MSTSEALEKLKDTSKFELLATSVLRKAKKDYRYILHSGLNAQGQPRKSPVDGFCKVPESDPPHVILVEHTITVEDKLEEKWLFDHRTVTPSTRGRKKQLSESDDGDLLKAARLFQEYKAEFPEAICTVVLTTTQGLQPDLWLKVEKKAKELGVKVDYWDRELIADFLDKKPEGQLIRKIYFGFDIKLSSEGLLREIAKISLDEHQRVFGLGNIDQAKEISREVHVQVISLIKQSSAALIGLQGASGTGKSTLLRQIGRDLNRNGDIAIWVSDEIVKSSSSLQELLLKALKCSHPSLNENAGIETIDIISQSSCKLVILIDDINRSDNPSKLLAHLEALARGVENKPIKFVVPLWLGQFSPKPREDKQHENIHWKTVELSTYSNSERLALSKQYDDRESEQINQLIEALNGDPFLCGIALSNRDNFSNYSSINLVQQIFNQFLEDLSEALARFSPRTFTHNECTETIDKLIEFILQEDNPEPPLEAIRDALGHKEDLLRNIAITNRLGWIDQREGVDFWRWKHDKIRDALIGRWLANTILVKLSPERMTIREQKYLSNLGLAEAWAFALAFKKRITQEQAINLLSKYQPLALAELLRLNFLPQSDNLLLLAAQSLRPILISYISQDGHTKDILQKIILNKLAETNNPLVLEATKELPENQIINIWASRFRNGDVLSAIEWIDYELQRGGFLPRINYPFFEESVKDFEKLYSNNRNKIIKKLKDFLNIDPTSISVISAILLAGYLTWEELAIPIWESWSNLPIEQKFIATPPLIWSLSRINNHSIENNLEEALLFSIQVRLKSDEIMDVPRVPHGIESIWQFWSMHVSPSLKWSITEKAANVWLRIINTSPDFEHYWDWLKDIDHPITIERFIRCISSKSKEIDNYWIRSLWENEMLENFHDPLAQIRLPQISYGSATRKTLLRLIKEETDPHIRLMSFLLWKRGATEDDLEKIQDIDENNNIFDEVLKIRLKLRDRTATICLIEKLQSVPNYWTAFVPFLQDIPEVFEAFLNTIDTALEFTDLERIRHRRNSVFKYLSVERLKEVLKKKRNLLIQSPQTWLSLWCSDVNEALNLVQEAMLQSEIEKWHIFFFPNDSFNDSISLSMLDSLIPVAQKYPHFRESIAERAARKGFRLWVYENFPDLVDSPTIRYYLPTKEDLINKLTGVVENNTNYNDLHLFSEELYTIELLFYQRDKSDYCFDFQVIFQEWIGSNVDLKRLNLTAKLFAFWGDSEDLNWWKDFEPIDKSAHVNWENTLSILQRRRWHTVDDKTIAFS